LTRKVSDAKWLQYVMWRQVLSRSAAAKKVGISYSAASNFDRGNPRSSGDTLRKHAISEHLDGPKPLDALSKNALRGLEDFGFFRHYFFGRLSTPWQEESAYKVIELLATKEKEYAVWNAPPGAGKSTAVHDIAAWITCRNRAIRGAFGSLTQKLAPRYTARLRRTFERKYPLKADPEELELGLAVDAQGTLQQEYGAFRPSDPDLWRLDEFVVAQMDETPIEEKEPTWSAYGLEEGIIGGRFDIMFWDDLIDEGIVASPVENQQVKNSWDKVAEKRLDPGGLAVLVGQRLGPEDLYGHNLRKKNELGTGPKYHHIKHRAHYEDRCKGEHALEAPYYPQGCLLDPRRVPWKELAAEMENDEMAFQIIYQQEDVDPKEVLVPQIAIHGGRDRNTGEWYPGCWDEERDLCELPSGVDKKKVASAAMVDPASANFWAIQWKTFDRPSRRRFLMDLERRRMDGPELLDWDEERRVHTGLMEDWQRRSVELGMPITHWIVETNTAQKWLLQYQHTKRWMQKWEVRIIAHETGKNKRDPKRGFESIGPHWKSGRNRLPGATLEARTRVEPLVHELTHWPHVLHDDCAMTDWFFEVHLPTILLATRPKKSTRPPTRPSWLKEYAVVGR
jgi:hypothetical protein